MLFTKKSFASLPWKLLLIEGLLVVLSVLLALALNSWRESRANQQLAERALQEVVDEVQTNCAQINTVQPYHLEVVNGEQNPAGVHIGFLRNDAWDVAKTSGAASYLDYELVSQIGEISAHQSDHRSIVQAYTEALFTNTLQIEQTEEMHQEAERGVIRELVRIQETLLNKYQGLQKVVMDRYGDTIETSGLCGEG